VLWEEEKKKGVEDEEKRNGLIENAYMETLNALRSD
jgi:hypothetical protein